MATLRELEDTLEDVKDNLYLASVKQSLALASYNTLLAETVENQKKEIASSKELSDMYETLYSDINKYYELLRNEQKIQVQRLRTSLLESMASLGADIGKTLVDGIKSGASKSDFAESLKELIREKMIEIAVYTEQFQNVLSDAGTKLMSGIVGGDDSLIQQAKEQLESLYDTAVQTAEIVDKKLSSIFKSIKDTAKSATSSIAESMKSISESAVTSLRNLAGSQKQISSLLTTLKVQSKSWESVKSVSTSLLKSSANSAKITLEVARKNLETQQKALDNASKKLNDSNAKLATAQQNLALSPYYGDLGIAIASRAYNQALLEQTVALKKYEEAEQKKNEAQQKSNSAQLAYNNALSAYEEKLAEVNPYLSQINEAESKYNSLISETQKQLSNENASLKAQIEAYRDLLTAQKDTVGFKTQLVNVRNQVLGIYDELSASALSLGESLVNAIANGMNKKDFSLELKDYIRQNIIKLNVYSGALGNRIATAGERLTEAIISQDNAGIKNAKSHMMTAYNEIDSLMKNIDKQLDDIFGKETEKEVEKTTTTIEKNLSRLEKAMDSFKETVSDLGGDIASNLIDGLSNGLSQSDFLSNMKDWIKKMLVQSVVYTEQMKSEIEAIGKTISNAISGGFTETSMHEIRRDLSFIFEQASSKMSGIDKILGGVFDGYASGTTSALSGLHIVGERGPELVRFNGGERVYNNADTMKMMSGSKTNNFNVTFNNLQDTSAFAMMNQLKRYNKEMAINGVI
jgi:DNA repair exonuclease SbcCD ATPase subunit